MNAVDDNHDFINNAINTSFDFGKICSHCFTENVEGSSLTTGIQIYSHSSRMKT